MAVFNKIKITKKGSILLNKVITRSEKLNISRIAIGKGFFDGDIWEIDNLVDFVMNADIIKSGETEGKWEIEVKFSNVDVTEDFEFKEVGIFATDPDGDEILYSYCNSGENGDYICAYAGDNYVEEYINLSLYTAGTAEVFAEIVKTTKAEEVTFNDTHNVGCDNVQEAIETIFEEAKNKDGGNADTVDGMHASDFSKVNHTHSYLPLSGGELSGNLKMGGNNIELKTVEYDSGYDMDMIRGSITISSTEIVGGKNEVYDELNSVLRNFDKVSALVVEATRVEAETLKGSGANVTNVNAVKLNGKNDTDFSLVGHTHTKNSITDFPETLPANGGNADTVGGYAVGKLMKDIGTFNVKDFNDLDINTVCNIQFVANTSQGDYHTPLGDVIAATWYNVITFGNDAGNRVTQIATLPYSHQRATYIRYKHDSTWSYWAKINDGGNAATIDGKQASYFATANHTHDNSYLSLSGGTVSGEIVAGNFTGDGSQLYGVNAETVNKKYLKYTTAVGSWFRLAKNNKNSCGGIFVLTVGSSGASSTTVFSVTQQYSSASSNTTAFKILSHSCFNKCVTKFRVVNKSSSVDQYIDFYVGGGTGGKEDSVEVQFFGKGWVICDSIISSNTVDDTYTYTEFEI